MWLAQDIWTPEWTLKGLSVLGNHVSQSAAGLWPVGWKNRPRFTLPGMAKFVPGPARTLTASRSTVKLAVGVAMALGVLVDAGSVVCVSDRHPPQLTLAAISATKTTSSLPITCPAGDGWLARDFITAGAGDASGGCGTRRGGYSQTMPSLSPSLREFS